MDNTQGREPLVTVAVIAYRASAFIEETLDSVKAQTYKNIELVISDDASPDDTVVKCEKWITRNRDRFTSVKLLIVDNNTGVAGNCKRALEVSTGVYYKAIGSDDILFSDCVENFVDFFQKNPTVKFSFAKEVRFTGEFCEHNFEYSSFPHRALCFRDKVTASQQFKTLTKNFIGCAPTMFVKTDLLKEIGFDDQYSTEDGPLFINMTRAGIKLDYMDKPVVYRRIHEQSITHEKDNNAILRSMSTPKNKKKWMELQYEYATPFWRMSHRYSNWLCKKIVEYGNDRRSFKCRFFNFLRRWINPFKWNLIWMNVQEYWLNRLGY